MKGVGSTASGVELSSADGATGVTVLDGIGRTGVGSSTVSVIGDADTRVGRTAIEAGVVKAWGDATVRVDPKTGVGDA
jgi:hypothetical protein